MSQTGIKLKAVSKEYSDADQRLCVLDNVSFDFPPGKSVAIIGRSGVGKSTMLHILGGLDDPTSGSVFINDQNISKLDNEALSSFRGQNLGFVFQFHHLLPEFSALENVSMPLVIAGQSDPEAESRSKQILERVGLSARLAHRPSQLSGGEQQRVAIARAVVNNPRVILADEPTGNLDLENAKLVQELLLSIQRELENNLIIVTHSRELASNMDLVLEMVPGGQLKLVA